MSRLTLASGEPVTHATIYYQPYGHQRISLWDGRRWSTYRLKLTKLEYLRALARQRGFISPRLAKRIRKAEGK